MELLNPSGTSDAYVIPANDHYELRFICRRHLRFAGLFDTEARHLKLRTGVFGRPPGQEQHAAD